MDAFLQAALAEARQSLAEGGIPIGSVLVHDGAIIGRGHNRRLQQGSVVLHAELDALENAGRRAAQLYRQCVLYTTLSPCAMCSGAILLYSVRAFPGSLFWCQGFPGCRSRLLPRRLTCVLR